MEKMVLTYFEDFKNLTCIGIKSNESSSKIYKVLCKMQYLIWPVSKKSEM